MEYYKAMRKNEPQIHATIWTNITKIILNERSQSQKSTYYMISFQVQEQEKIIQTIESHESDHLWNSLKGA